MPLPNIAFALRIVEHDQTSKSLQTDVLVVYCACNVVVCLQGYIQNRDDIFHVGFLSRLSEPGALFDPRKVNSAVTMVPIGVTSLVIFWLNSAYGSVASWLTRFENHASPEDHRTSLVIKRFLFTAFDSYIALFYLAFWQLDALKTRQELQGLFTADCLRRLGTEVVVPWVMQRGAGIVRRQEVC